MSEGSHCNAAGAVKHDGEGVAVVPGIVEWLSLAAAPTFAVMALLAAVAGNGPLDNLCAAATSPVGGMVPMYLLMSAFHSAPWFKMISGRRGGFGRV